MNKEQALERNGSLLRKNTPVFSGFFAYFPDAIKAVARHSKRNNEKHNPGEPLHWAKEKSNDHLDCLGRHLLDHATEKDLDSLVAVAWRAMAELQIHIERKAEKE